MSKYNLDSLTARLAEKTGLSQQNAELFVRRMFDVLDEGLRADKQVKVKWLGTFKVAPVKDRESVDVNTGERIVIEGRDKLTFVPDSILKEIVNKPFAQFDTVVVNDGVDFEEIDRKFESLEDAPSADDAVPGGDSSEMNLEETPAPEEAQGTSESSDAPLPEPAASEHLAADESAADAPGAGASGGVVSFDMPSEDLSLESISDEVVVIGSDCNILLGAEAACEEEEADLEEDDAADIVEEGTTAEEETSAPIAGPVGTSAETQAEDSVESSADEPVVQSEESPSNTPIEAPISESLADDSTAVFSEEEVADDGDRVLISRKLMLAACVAFALLVGAIGWFAFNYGKMASQRDTLTLQLDSYRQSDGKKQSPISAPQEETLRKKAMEDSTRMAKASEAVKMAEDAEDKTQAKTTEESHAAEKKFAEKERLADEKEKLAAERKKAAERKQAEEKLAAEKKAVAEKKQAKDLADKSSSSQYDKDVRIRTGAYRIVGVAQVLTVREGQTLKSISKAHLGPGMECYLEALNGNGELKAGQKVKIPKLQLKKK